MGVFAATKRFFGRIQVFAGTYDNAVFVLPTIALVIDDDQEEHAQMMARDPVWRPEGFVPHVPTVYFGIVLHWLHLQVTVRIRVGARYTPPFPRPPTTRSKP